MKDLARCLGVSRYAPWVQTIRQKTSFVAPAARMMATWVSPWILSEVLTSPIPTSFQLKTQGFMAIAEPAGVRAPSGS